MCKLSYSSRSEKESVNISKILDEQKKNEPDEETQKAIDEHWEEQERLDYGERESD